MLEESETAKEQVKYFILHQANARMIESIAKRLDVPVEKFPMNLKPTEILQRQAYRFF